MVLYTCLLVFSQENSVRNSYSVYFIDKMRLYKCTVSRHMIDAIVVCVLSLCDEWQATKRIHQRVGRKPQGYITWWSLKSALSTSSWICLLILLTMIYFGCVIENLGTHCYWFQINENKEKTYLECHSYNESLRWPVSESFFFNTVNNSSALWG